MVVVDHAPSEQYPHVLAHFLRMVLAVDGFLQVSIIHVDHMLWYDLYARNLT